MKLFRDLRDKLYAESPESRERVEEKKNLVVQAMQEWVDEREVDQLTMDPCVERTWQDEAKEYNDRIKKAYKSPDALAVVPNPDATDYIRRRMRLQ